MDRGAWEVYGVTFLENTRRANISYFLLAALDSHTSLALHVAGVTQCFDAPRDRLAYKGTDSQYTWGSHHWTQTTWNKGQDLGELGSSRLLVHAPRRGAAVGRRASAAAACAAAVLLVHVVQAVYELGVHVVHSDADVTWVADPLPYFLSHLGGPAHVLITTDAVATANRNQRHPLYGVHWVWGGSTFESKRQTMREMLKYHDPDEYYTAPDLRLLTFDLQQLQASAGWFDTERMSRFHVAALNHQLQQAYFALAVALIANRTLVMPRFKCYCAKNWYRTLRCRIFNDWATQFPFDCPLSSVLRVKRLHQGVSLPGSSQYAGHRVFTREYSFLENPRAPPELKASYVELVPSWHPRPPGLLRPDQLVLSKEQLPARAAAGPLPAATATATHDRTARPPPPPSTSIGDGGGLRLAIAAPLSDQEMRPLLDSLRDVRVLHLPRPAATLAGFADGRTAAQYDEEVQRLVTYWCCTRDPAASNMTERLQMVALPRARQGALPALDERTSYMLEQLREWW
ncbi:hypothetical protein TSOC_001648 [Tetrabaena socialis]|uniref:Nucleotide-diphospho-sugar transferase domain-containing protein n=1 Tax=Tetrabaena socialis TaxID=47790 RepID=A0A2J8AGB7_9CHLO|nr:hypothetical protein TSOC_001648 [Tetrabaena socialis]|eukprot:PNH11559.1 hypothetical protein TSOC_001648 [Tetrabaena socialis]